MRPLLAFLTPLLAHAAEPVITSVEPVRIASRAIKLVIIGEGFDSSARVRLPTDLAVSGTLDEDTAGLCALTAVNGEDVSNPKALEVTAYTEAPSMSEPEAFRFLQHATFGPTRATVDRLRAIGYHNWFTEQFDPGISSGYPLYLDENPVEWSQNYFFQNANSAPDQLWQRMAFALHNIFVVSADDVENAEVYLSYLRVLHRDALGPFATLLRDITLNPAMGEYLDMVNNAKARRLG